jgi:hypothetical protein
MKPRDSLIILARGLLQKVWEDLTLELSEQLSDRQRTVVNERIKAGRIIFSIALDSAPTAAVSICSLKGEEGCVNVTFQVENNLENNQLCATLQFKTPAQMKLDTLVQKVQAAAPGQAIDVSKVMATEEEIIRDTSGEIVKIIRRPVVD